MINPEMDDDGPDDAAYGQGKPGRCACGGNIRRVTNRTQGGPVTADECDVCRDARMPGVTAETPLEATGTLDMSRALEEIEEAILDLISVLSEGFMRSKLTALRLRVNHLRADLEASCVTVS